MASAYERAYAALGFTLECVACRRQAKARERRMCAHCGGLLRPNPNTQAKHRSMLISFFDWLMEEGLRKDNPARQTRRPKRRRERVR